jgi:hypothetical protein
VKALLVAAAVGTAIVLGTAPAARAQEDAGAIDPAQDRATEFVAVDGAVAEDVPGGPLLVGAYGLVLLVVLGYVLRLGFLQAATARDLDRLGKTLAGKGEEK